MRVLAVVLAVLPGVAGAEEWRALDGGAIKAALEGREVNFGAARQNFEAGGLTVMFADAPSTGQWRVDQNQYCILWEPATTWDCFGVEAKVGAVRFTAADGVVTQGTYMDDPAPAQTIMQ